MDRETASDHAPVGSTVTLLLRAEAVVACALAIWGYRHLGGGWALFAALFLVPDVSMLGYLRGRRLGAHAYNAAHTYLAPAVLALAGVLVARPTLVLVGLIWAAHIGFDRALGFGLKYPAGFNVTHLG